MYRGITTALVDRHVPGNSTTIVDRHVQGQHSNSCRQTDTYMYLTKAFGEQTCPGAAKSVENQTPAGTAIALVEQPRPRAAHAAGEQSRLGT